MESRPVIYIAGECHNGIKRRLTAWEQHFELSLKDAPLFVSSAPVPILDVAAAQVVRQKVDEVASTEGCPALIIIDTLARNFGDGDENSTKDMNAFVTAVDDLRRDYCATALIVHHSGHGDKSRGRGAMSLKGALDAEFMVKTSGELMTITATKMKDAALPDPLYRRFETVELGKASDGTVMTSAVLLPTEGGVAHDKKVHPTQREQYGIQSYCEVAKDKGHISADGKELLVHAEDWRPAFYMCIALDDAAAKKKAFQRVREGLMSKGFLAQPQEEYYRLSGDYTLMEQSLIVEMTWAAERDNGTETGQQRDNVPDSNGTGRDTPL